MKISILTLFPEMFYGPFDHSILQRAQKSNVISIEICNIRNYGIGKHKIVDDKPYGGGVGMVMRVDVLAQAIEKARCKKEKHCQELVVLLDPQGRKFSQPIAKQLSTLEHIILVCGRYEGYDERIRQFVDEEVSIGDYVLTGGEIPAMVITDAVVRLIPDVLGKDESSLSESFQEISFEKNGKNVSAPVLEYPQYTQPQEYKGVRVPDILLSGNHKEIMEWRKQKALEKTKEKRPDLLTGL